MSAYGDDLNCAKLVSKDAVLTVGLSTANVTRLGAAGIVAATVPANDVGNVGDVRIVSGNATATTNGVYYKSGAATWTQVAQMNAAGA